MKVIPWTVNHPADMEKLYAMGVDGMISDHPWVLREFLESNGAALFPGTAVEQPYHLEPDHIDAQTEKAADGSNASH